MGGGVLAVFCFGPNERQAKLAASFDPEGIKMVLRVEVERSGLPPFSSRLTCRWERRALLCGGILRAGSSSRWGFDSTPWSTNRSAGLRDALISGLITVHTFDITPPRSHLSLPLFTSSRRRTCVFERFLPGPSSRHLLRCIASPPLKAAHLRMHLIGRSVAAGEKNSLESISSLLICTATPRTAV